VIFPRYWAGWNPITDCTRDRPEILIHQHRLRTGGVFCGQRTNWAAKPQGGNASRLRDRTPAFRVGVGKNSSTSGEASPAHLGRRRKEVNLKEFCMASAARDGIGASYQTPADSDRACAGGQVVAKGGADLHSGHEGRLRRPPAAQGDGGSRPCGRVRGQVPKMRADISGQKWPSPRCAAHASKKGKRGWNDGVGSGSSR